MKNIIIGINGIFASTPHPIASHPKSSTESSLSSSAKQGIGMTSNNGIK